MTNKRNSAVAVSVATGSLVVAWAVLFTTAGQPASGLQAAGHVPLPQIIDIEVDDLAVSPGITPTSPDERPLKIRSLHRQRVRIRGYMFPTFKEHGITQFLFNGETKRKAVYALAGLGSAHIHYVIPVTLREGEIADYSQKPFVVEGTLRVEPEWNEGAVWQLYTIDDATITPTQPRPGYHSPIHWGC